MDTYRGVTVFGEITEGKLPSITTDLLGDGRTLADQLKEELSCLLFGHEVSDCAPEAIAISGTSQHLAGCFGAKTIVAINRDPEANIFNVAHFGAVGDWKQILPSFIEKVKEFGLK